MLISKYKILKKAITEISDNERFARKNLYGEVMTKEKSIRFASKYVRKNLKGGGLEEKTLKRFFTSLFGGR
jgi:hypothetical protein